MHFFTFLYAFVLYIWSIFFYPPPRLNINVYFFLFGLLYFLLWFFSFYFLGRYGVLGFFFHAFLMASISFLKVILPLHPFILLYPSGRYLFPSTNYPFLNVFFLFFISDILFCKSRKFTRVLFFLGVFFILMKNMYINSAPRVSDFKIAVIQVGLYFEKGGSTTDFFNDLFLFLERNKTVNAIVFSENNLFSFKVKYNRELTEKLLNGIKILNSNRKFHFFLSVNGYNDFNNIVTLYQFGDDILINQKRTLIPYIEKPGFFNRKNNIDSEYYYVYKSHKNHIFNIDGVSVSTYICYDALFPEIKNDLSDVVFIQSNYKLLDKGYGYDRLTFFASYLAKFLNGMHSQLVVNVQNYGGTVVIYNDWSIDHKIYEISKNEPFFIINTGKSK